MDIHLWRTNKDILALALTRIGLIILAGVEFAGIYLALFRPYDYANFIRKLIEVVS